MSRYFSATWPARRFLSSFEVMIFIGHARCGQLITSCLCTSDPAVRRREKKMIKKKKKKEEDDEEKEEEKKKKEKRKKKGHR